jgi:hypothetical protein
MRLSRCGAALLMTGYVLYACSSSDKKDLLLIEAARYHQPVTEIQVLVEPQIEQIDSLKLVPSAQKMPSAQVRATTLDSLKTAFGEWEKNLIEVVGIPHKHLHRTGGHTYIQENRKALARQN